MSLGAFRVLLPALRGHARDLTIALSAAIGAQASGIVLPLIARWMIDRTTQRQASHAESILGHAGQLWWTIPGIILGLALLKGFFIWQETMRSERIAQMVLADLRVRMYQHVQRLSQGYFDRRPAGRVMIRFIGDANALRTWLGRTVIGIPADILTVLAFAVAIGMIHPQFLLAAVLPVVLLVPVLALINPRARRLTRAGRRHQSHLGAMLAERLTLLGAIKACNAQDVDRAEVQNTIRQVAVANTSRGRLDAWSNCFAIMLTTVALGAVVFVGIRLHLNRQLSHGDLLAAVWMTLLLRHPIQRLTTANVVHQRARVAVERMSALLQHRTEPGWSPDLRRYEGPGRTIELRHLGCKYQGKSWVLHDVNATLRGPALISVTDEVRGLGSIFLELLLRIRRPERGRIYLDDVDVRHVRVADVRRRMGWVDGSQKIRDVVALVVQSEPETTRHALYDKIWTSTELIAPGATMNRCIDTERCSLHPPAVNGTIGRDVHLRFAMCCALLHDPPILLLDNPTDGLDVGGVQRLIEWLRQEATTRLVIIATNDVRVVEASSQSIHLPRVVRRRARGKRRQPPARDGQDRRGVEQVT